MVAMMAVQHYNTLLEVTCCVLSEVQESIFLNAFELSDFGNA